MYTMHAVISVALPLEYATGADPIVEIAAPEDYAGQPRPRHRIRQWSRYDLTVTSFSAAAA